MAESLMSVAKIWMGASRALPSKNSLSAMAKE